MRGLGSLVRQASNLRHSELTLVDGDTFVSSEAVQFFGPNQNTGITATRPQVESLTTVYRAVQFLSGTASILDMFAYNRTSMAPAPREHPSVRLLEDPTGGIMTASEWRDWEMRCRLLRGNSFAIKDGMTPRSPQPSRFFPLDPDRVTIHGVYRGGRLVERLYVLTRVFQPVQAGTFDDLMDRVPDTVVIDQRDMLHVPGQNFDGVSGMSPIDVCRLALSVEAATEEASARFYGKGSMLSGILKTGMPLKKEQADALKQRWQQKMGGSSNAYEVAVMDSGVEFQPVSVSPEQAQFIQMRQFNVEQTARVFGVPPFLLMSSSAGQSFGTGLEQQLTATDIFTLRRWLKSLEDRATFELLPSTQVARFDMEPLNRADFKSRWAGYAIARKNGILSVDEIRLEEDWPALDTETSRDPEAPVPQGTPANEPGGNDGLQGGGEDAEGTEV